MTHRDPAQARSVSRTARRSIERTVDAWFDDPSDARSLIIFGGAFVAAWTVFYTVSCSSWDLHPDMVELYNWGRHPSAGYYKHPPLGALAAIAWLSVFPLTDWSFYALGMVNAAAGLIATGLIARRYLSADKARVALLLLLLTPLYQFLGDRFASNQTLLSTWPIATYCFLRAFENRGALWSVAAGVAAALAMSGKYFSVFLIAGFIVAAITHPARWDYIRSPSPWISTAAGLIVMAPHLRWLVVNDFPTFTYALSVHTDPALGPVLRGMLSYLAGGIAYLVIAAAVYWAAVRPTLPTLRELAWPADPDRRMLVVLLATFVLSPVVAAPFLGLRLVSVWIAQAWFLLPIVMLSSDRVMIARREMRRIAYLVLAITAACLIAAPAVACYYHWYQALDERAYYRGLSAQLTELWHADVGSRLPIVMGTPEIGIGVAYYGADRPEAVPGVDPRKTAPWVGASDLAHKGFVVVCAREDHYCRSDLETIRRERSAARVREITVSNSFLGHVSASRQFVVLIVPPQNQSLLDRFSSPSGS